jgi:tRNA threonylcarbamoyladenosine biosynthesis protein TsaB
MNILALDTATSILSLALGTDRGLWSFEADAGLRHSEILMDALELLMKTAGLKPGELEGVVCMKGPGSFTGLRIGFSAAKGLALSLGIPLASVPTLDCMALPFSRWPGLVLPLLDAKKSRYFTALYRGGRRLSEYMDAEIRRIGEEILTALAAVPAGERRVLLTGPEADLGKGELDKISVSGAGFSPPLQGDLFCLDPEFRRGWARCLVEVAKNDGIPNNRNGNVEIFSGPEYFRQSDAELLFRSG